MQHTGAESLYPNIDNTEIPTNPTPPTSINKQSNQVALSDTLRTISAIVAAEGDLKLTSEIANIPEHELLATFLENPAISVPALKAKLLLTILSLITQLQPALLLKMDSMSPREMTNLFKMLIESVGVLDPTPSLTQNNLNLNFDPNDAISRLAKRMNIEPD